MDTCDGYHIPSYMNSVLMKEEPADPVELPREIGDSEAWTNMHNMWVFPCAEDETRQYIDWMINS